MPSFDFASAASVEDALELLAADDDGSHLLGGGTDLLAQVYDGRLAPLRVIDLKRIPELTAVEVGGSHDAVGLRLGAAVPCVRIYGDARIAARYPGLVDSASLIGGKGIQGRASFGGNLCNASPAADSIPAMIVHEAVATIAGPNGRRDVPVAEFCTGPGQTVLEPGELLVSLSFPAPRPRSGAAYLRFTPRNEMDIAVVGVGAALSLAEDGTTIERAALALGAVGPTPIVATEAARALVGTSADAEAVGAAAHLAREAARPIDDLRGTAAQRRHLVGVYTKRALERALERAHESLATERASDAGARPSSADDDPGGER